MRWSSLDTALGVGLLLQVSVAIAGNCISGAKNTDPSCIDGNTLPGQYHSTAPTSARTVYLVIDVPYGPRDRRSGEASLLVTGTTVDPWLRLGFWNIRRGGRAASSTLRSGLAVVPFELKVTRLVNQRNSLFEPPATQPLSGAATRYTAALAEMTGSNAVLFDPATGDGSFPRFFSRYLPTLSSTEALWDSPSEALLKFANQTLTPLIHDSDWLTGAMPDLAQLVQADHAYFKYQERRFSRPASLVFEISNEDLDSAPGIETINPQMQRYSVAQPQLTRTTQSSPIPSSA
ncbi:MAG: hypothetical protein M1825_001211 [Sarcosagium campestre]|nr:MAG: hypothetical protein M1825_001211 [Sarcosagium campestre]